MRISRIVAWTTNTPLNEPYTLSGRKQRRGGIDSTIIRIDRDDGVPGWGESYPRDNTYLPAHTAGARAGFETIPPVLIGVDPHSVEHVGRVMDDVLRAQPYVKSGLDGYCWAVFDKTAGLPFWPLFGAAAADPVEAIGAMSVGDLDDTLDQLAFSSEVGFRTCSAKSGADDIARIEALHAALSPANRWASGVGGELIDDFCHGTDARIEGGYASPQMAPGHDVVLEQRHLCDPVGVFERRGEHEQGT